MLFTYFIIVIKFWFYNLLKLIATKVVKNMKKSNDFNRIVLTIDDLDISNDWIYPDWGVDKSQYWELYWKNKILEVKIDDEM